MLRWRDFCGVRQAQGNNLSKLARKKYDV